MYEEVQVKRRFDWKKAFTKLGFLTLFIIIIALIIVIPSNKTYAESEYEHNLRAFMSAAKEYFNDGRLPSENGNESIIKLQDLIDEGKLKNINLERENCNKEQSFAKITKLSNKEYSIHVYLECSSNQLSSVDTIRK